MSMLDYQYCTYGAWVPMDPWMDGLMDEGRRMLASGATLY